MAQPVALPALVASTANTQRTYCVIDNGPANTGTDQSGAPLGYDNTTGALSQGANLSQTNGPIPDFYVPAAKGATAITVSAVIPRTLCIFKNPA